MRQELKRCSSIGDKNGILFLCRKLLTGNNVSLSSVKAACSFVEGIDLVFPCGILALQELDLLNVDGDLCVTKSLTYNEIHEDAFIRELCSHCFNALSKNGLFDDEQVTYDEQEDLYYIPRRAFRLESAVFRNLLISFGAVKTDGLKFIISNEYEQIFKKAIKHKRTMALSQLMKKLEHERLMGEEGELFVLDFERKRCPYTEQQKKKIKQISEIDVSAGYDIISFHRETSTQRRYIEVKTFEGNNHFHWSKNEINSAKLRKRDYYIYLVDYNKITEEDYVPTMIQDPYQEVFVEGKWSFSVDSYLIEEKIC